MSRVAVTGGAGFIGGVTVLKLLDAGHSVYAIDRVTPSKLLCESEANWLTGDFSGEVALESIRMFKPDAVIHCAGTSLVGPSVNNPKEYYDNNFVKTKIMLDYLIKHNIKTRVIFSSSAATYGNPIMTPVQEIDPTEPISPYGESKLMTDWMLQSYQRAYGLDFVSFRYFNACGADSQGRHGQEPGATHIIARVIESIRNKTEFCLYGNNYETPDGTCIRDYVHVEDIADAHILALDKTIPSGVYNLGTSLGTSNLEIIHQTANIAGVNFPVRVEARRNGDPTHLTAESVKFQKISGWQSKYTITDIIQHAWNWYNV